MRIVVAHMGPISELIVASSVNLGIKGKPVETKISWVVADENKYIFKHNKNVDEVFSEGEFMNRGGEFDLLINLWPSEIKTEATIRDHIGFGSYKEFEPFKEVLLHNKSIPQMSSQQLYFILAGLRWKGEGYNIPYFPKSRSRKNRVGVAVSNANLRNYVLDKLDLEGSKVWNIPYRKNIFKKMDEVNKCKRIITDDATIFHLSMNLRKYVYLLETIPFNLRIETYGQGETYRVPLSIVR